MQQINVTVNNKRSVEPLVQIKSATISFPSVTPSKKNGGTSISD